MSNETVASAFVMCYAVHMSREKQKIYRIAFKLHNGAREQIKRLPKGTTLAQANTARAKMGADPKIEYAELREEWK